MRALLLLLLGALPAAGQTLVAVRRVPAQGILTPQDIRPGESRILGGIEDPAQALGAETRVALYPGQPIMAADLAPPALVERNQIVRLEYRAGALVIETEGRALGRAAAGETVRVLNLASKATLSGRVGENGRILLGEQP